MLHIIINVALFCLGAVLFVAFLPINLFLAWAVLVIAVAAGLLFAFGWGAFSVVNWTINAPMAEIESWAGALFGVACLVGAWLFIVSRFKRFVERERRLRAERLGLQTEETV